MAIDLTLKGIGITNRELASPLLRSPGAAGGKGELTSLYDYLASVPAALSATSVIRLVEVPSNAVIRRVGLLSAAQAAGAGDVGVYRNNKDGGAVIDADFFATAVSVASAVLDTDITAEATSGSFNDIVKRGQPLWQALGLTSDPKTTFDIAFTVTTDITTGLAPLGLRVDYVL